MISPFYSQIKFVIYIKPYFERPKELKQKTSNTQVNPSATLKDVLESLENNIHRICTVVDEDKTLLGTITDGDCRRAIIKGHSLETPAEALMNKNYLAVDSSFSNDQIRSLMFTNDLNQIPIIDQKRRLVDVVSREFLRQQRNPKQNSALILAGGKGTRLRPLTENVPKPMLPVRGKPMIEYIVENLVQNGITDIFISINYLGHIIEKHFGDGSSWGCKISYVKEELPLGTAGSLRLIKDQVENPILIVNGDLVTGVNFGACLDFHYTQELDMSVGTSTYSVQVPYGILSLTDAGKVVDIEEKPTKRYQANAGLYVINPSLIEHIPAERIFHMTDLLQVALSKQMNVGAFPIHESWLDIGIPKHYESAQNM